MQLVMQKDGQEGRDGLDSTRPEKNVSAVLCSSGLHVERGCVCVARCSGASWIWLEHSFISDLNSCVETLGMEEHYLRTSSR